VVFVDLINAIDSAVEKAVSEEKTAILFSGGVDSSLLAFIAKKTNPEVVLYTVGTSGSEDIIHAMELASEMKMKQKILILNDQEIAELYQEAKIVTGEESRMKLELSVPLLALCKKASADKVRNLICGSGAEELFLGYNSHKIEAKKETNLEKLRKKELAELYEKDVKRNEMIAENCGVALLAPFLDKEVVKAALEIPAKENFCGDENKHILRKAARKAGLPESACARPKRAMQYGSGVHERIEKLMRQGRII